MFCFLSKVHDASTNTIAFTKSTSRSVTSYRLAWAKEEANAVETVVNINPADFSEDAVTFTLYPVDVGAVYRYVLESLLFCSSCG